MSEFVVCKECKAFYSSPPPVPVRLPREKKNRLFKCFACGYTVYQDGTIKHGKKFQKEDDKKEDKQGTGQD